MHTEHIIRAVAGILTVVGIALALWVNIYWMILPGFVGFNLLQSAFSKFCPLEVFINNRQTIRNRPQAPIDTK